VGKFNLAYLLKQAKLDDSSDGSIWECDSIKSCILRVRLMLPLMREYLKKVRVSEEILSEATVTGGQVMSAHNAEQHRLPQFNYVRNGSSERISKYAAWKTDQATLRAQIHKLATASHSEKLSVPKAPTHLIPSCEFAEKVAGSSRRYQVLFIERDKTVYLGVNMDVYKSALSKTGERKAGGTRVMWAAEPATYSVPIHACEVVKVCVLQRVGEEEPNAWLTSCVEQANLVDPLLVRSGVIGVAAVEKIVSRDGVLKLTLPPNTDTVLKLLQDRPSHVK
jgi:hypothetical protein